MSRLFSLPYRKVPKVTSLVTFGFSTLLLSLLSGTRYFPMAKTCFPHWHFKKTIAKNVKGILFESRQCMSCTLRVMNRNVKYSLLMFRLSVIPVIFFAKREISLEVSTFGGSLVSGGSLLLGFLLTPVTFYRYFRRERERENNFREVLLNILVKSSQWIAYSLVSNMNYKEKRVSTNQFRNIKIHTGLRGLGE